MEFKKSIEIQCAIDYLEAHGYVVKKDFKNLIGKWALFWQEGMDYFLHGKVIDIHYGRKNDVFVIKCKNGERRYASIDKIFDFYDDKKDCYSIKGTLNGRITED